MKTTLLLAAALALFTHTAGALTEVHEITSAKDCPENLSIRVEPVQSDPNLMVISVTLTPHPPEAYRERVKAYSHILVASRGITVFKGQLETTKEDGAFHCRLQLRAEYFGQSHLTISSQLHEQDDHPTLGGGEIYKISLQGFLPSIAEEQR